MKTISEKMFSVWFACGTCRGSFQKLNDFLQRKKQYHLKEYQNTKCIIFEERAVLTNDKSGDFSPTISKLEDKHPHDDQLDLPEVKVENENKIGRSIPEFQCTTDETAEFLKTDHQSNAPDFEKNLDNVIPLKSITSKISYFSSKPSLKNSCIPQESISKNNLDFKNTNAAIKKPTSTSSKTSDLSLHLNSIQARHNPFVLVRRLTVQEIQNYCHSENYSNSKYKVKADRSRKKSNGRRIWSVSFTKSQSVISTTSKKVKNSFECKLCLEKFNSNSKLTYHLSSCAVTHPHRHRFCVLCNQKFYKKTNLVRHVLKCPAGTVAKHCNSKKMKQCNHCPMTFLYESELSRHARTHTDGKNVQRRKRSRPFNCQDCGVSLFYRYTLLDVGNSTLPSPDTIQNKCLTRNCHGIHKIERTGRHHITIHRYTRPVAEWKCPKLNCNITYQNKYSIKKHLLTHSNKKSFKCHEADCHKSLKTKQSLRDHVKTHAHVLSFKCPKPNCTKLCKTKQCLRDHMIIHTDSRPFKCPEKDCVGRYKTKCNLMNHLKAHENQDLTVESNSDSESHSVHVAASAAAERNSRTYSRADSKTNEISQSAQDAAEPVVVWFKCTKLNCAKQYKKYCELKLHLRTHSDLPHITCPEGECGKSFRTVGFLRQHLLTHSDARPFKCEHAKCQKTFKSKISLRQHVITHLDSRPFKCP